MPPDTETWLQGLIQQHEVFPSKHSLCPPVLWQRFDDEWQREQSRRERCFLKESDDLTQSKVYFRRIIEAVVPSVFPGSSLPALSLL